MKSDHDERLLRYMLDTFGPTMDMNQLAGVLHKSPKTLRMDYTRDMLPVPTYKLGRKRVVQTLEVVDYIQQSREEAA